MPVTTSTPSPWSRLARRLRLNVPKSHGDRFLRLAAEARSQVREIPAPEAARSVDGGAFLVDVRERGEFAQRHAAGAENFGRGTIELEIEHFVPDPDAPIICYCSSGNRAALVASNLQRMGYTNVRSIAGGLPAWIAAGLPTTSEREFLD